VTGHGESRGCRAAFREAAFRVLLSSNRKLNPEEDVMPVWAWILIIVLLVLLLTGGVYVRR
jgi:hypothetical protein